MSRSFKSTQTIKNYLNGVKLLHLYTGHNCPKFNNFQISLVLKGVARMNPHTPKRVLPITPTILLQIHSLLSKNDSFEASIWCAFIFGFFLMARKSNLVPKTEHSFDPDKHLCRNNIFFNESGLIVVFRWSKTNQFGERIIQVPITAIPNSPLCPVQAYTNMITLVPANERSPAFVYYNKKGKLKTITHQLFTATLRKMLTRCGIQPESYSGHSFRRGGASWAFSKGVPGELIQIHGDWHSDAYKLYFSLPIEIKLSVTQRMSEYI